MKRALLVFATVLALQAQAQTRQLFDHGWQFTREGKTITVDLPHDWDIYFAPNPATGATGTGGGWYPGGKGEYRKSFPTPKGEMVKLHFEGVYQKAEVFINGQKAGQHAYGYTPFTVDVTPYLYKDKRQNKVLAFASADLKDREIYTSPCVTTWKAAHCSWCEAVRSKERYK